MSVKTNVVQYLLKTEGQDSRKPESDEQEEKQATTGACAIQ